MAKPQPQNLGDLQRGTLFCLADLLDKAHIVHVLEVLAHNQALNVVGVAYRDQDGYRKERQLKSSLQVFTFTDALFGDLNEGDFFGLFGQVNAERRFVPMIKRLVLVDALQPPMTHYNAIDGWDQTPLTFIGRAPVSRLRTVKQQ